MLNGKFKMFGSTKQLSRIVLGTFTLGSLQSESESFKLMDRYFELTGRTIDTARSYNGEDHNGDSKSERTIARWLRKTGVRDEISLITKGAYPELRDLNYSRLSPDCIRYDINTSLAVLDQEYVEVFFLHRDDADVPVDEIVDATSQVVEDGLAKAVGVSNWTTDRINAANTYAKKKGKVPFTISEIQWNTGILTKEMQLEFSTGPLKGMVCMLPKDYEWYKSNDFSVMAYSSQAVGFFSKYLATGADSLHPRAKRYLTEPNIKRAHVIWDMSKELGCTPSQLITAYITNNPLDGYAVIGSHTIAQIEDVMGAADMVIDQEIIDQIDKAGLE